MSLLPQAEDQLLAGCRTFYLVSGQPVYLEVDIVKYFEQISEYNPTLSKISINDFTIKKMLNLSDMGVSNIIAHGVEGFGVLTWKRSVKTFVVKNGELFIFKGILIRRFESEFIHRTIQEQYCAELKK